MINLSEFRLFQKTNWIDSDKYDCQELKNRLRINQKRVTKDADGKL